MIPLKYNVRNLRVRWKTTLMTVLGTGLGRLVVVHSVRPGRGPGAQPDHLGRPARPDRDAQGFIDGNDRRIRDRQGRRDSDSAGNRSTTRKASRLPPRSS